MQPSPKIAVVYLARFAEGVEPIKQFAASWKRHPSGIDCDLIVVWKGFPDMDHSDSEQEKALCGLDYHSIRMSDAGFDLTAYKRAAGQFTHDYICCLNTFSQIESDNWLLKLYDVVTDYGIGMAGATASFESVGQSMKLMNRDVFYVHHKIRYNRVIAERWRDEILKNPATASWLERGPRATARHIFKLFVLQKPYPRISHLNVLFEDAWRKHAETFDRFPRFPNPHIRSNAFIIERELFLQLTPGNLTTKEECYEFESGYTSLSRKIVALGLANMVVGADGRAYSEANWKISKTFRGGGQINKLVSDNQTRGFDKMNKHRRDVLELWTWGDGETVTPTMTVTENAGLPNPHDPLPFGPELFA